MGRFDNKAVIVTGSSSGIGRAVLLAFAQEGAKVTIHGTDSSRIEEIKKLLIDSHIDPSHFISVQGDIQENSVRKELIDKTVEAFGQIDVLVNNAGISSKWGTDPTSEENFDFVVGICFKA